MAGHEHITNLDPTVQLVNSYNAIPQKDRTEVLAGLRLAARQAPTAAEINRARQESGVTPFDSIYTALADAYAMGIDIAFNRKNLQDNNPETIEKRGVYLGMIKPLTAEQIDKGVTEILRIEARGTSGQK
jgi:hypothetical protein